MLENALARPGQILACTDSHTIAAGALNCAARGLGVLEMLQICSTGQTWYRVSPAIRVELVGHRPDNVFGKDIFLHLANVLGSVEGHDIEFTGPAIAELPMAERASLTTMCAELSANFALFPADEVTRDHVRRADPGNDQWEPVVPDPGADYVRSVTVDLGQLRPSVARPDFVAHNAVTPQDLDEPVPIHQAFIGSCANGKLDDLAVAALIVRGRKVAQGVRFLVTPASQRVYLDAVRAGYVADLVEAGAVVTNSTCGACYGGHLGLLGPGENCIASSTRNFSGRMGSPEAKIYLASSATVAASALTGIITDPTRYLAGAR